MIIEIIMDGYYNHQYIVVDYLLYVVIIIYYRWLL